MNDYVKAWQCIGCGRIEAPQTCIGVCRDQKVELVYAEEHEQALARAKALESVVRRLAFSTPRPSEWERSYRAAGDGATRTRRLSAVTRLTTRTVSFQWAKRSGAAARPGSVTSADRDRRAGGR